MDEGTSPLDAKVNGTPLSVLISQAARLKAVQIAPLRSNYDRQPIFRKNSLFPDEDVALARKKPFQDRMEDANKFKQSGNRAFREHRYSDALSQYTKAVSTFIYLEHTNHGWKKEGIMDKFIQEVEFQSSKSVQNDLVRSFLLACYTNMAIIYLRAKEYSSAIDACNEALSINENHAKALFLRYQARISPKSAGEAEEKMAKKDLETALVIDPKNIAIMREMRSFLLKKKHQLRKEKIAFEGIFHKGTIYDDKNYNRCTRGTDMRATDLGFSNEINNHKNVNFHYPSQRIIKEAKKGVIDLQDPSVIEKLERLLTEEQVTEANKVIFTRNKTRGRLTCFLLGCALILYYMIKSGKWHVLNTHEVVKLLNE